MCLIFSIFFHISKISRYFPILFSCLEIIHYFQNIQIFQVISSITQVRFDYHKVDRNDLILHLRHFTSINTRQNYNSFSRQPQLTAIELKARQPLFPCITKYAMFLLSLPEMFFLKIQGLSSASVCRVLSVWMPGLVATYLWESCFSRFASFSWWIKHGESLSAGSDIHRLPRLEKTLKDLLIPPPVTKHDDSYTYPLQREGSSCHQSLWISRLSLYDPVSG